MLLFCAWCELSAAGEGQGFALEPGVGAVVCIIVDSIALAVDVAQGPVRIGQVGDVGRSRDGPGGAFVELYRSGAGRFIRVHGALPGGIFLEVKGNGADVVGQDVAGQLLPGGCKGEVAAVCPFIAPLVAGHVNESVAFEFQVRIFHIGLGLCIGDVKHRAIGGRPQGRILDPRQGQMGGAVAGTVNTKPAS